LLSGVTNVAPRSSSAAGPFLFMERAWAKIVSSRPDLSVTVANRFDPEAQILVAAAELVETERRFLKAGVPAPTPGQHAFVRLFGTESVDELIKVLPPNPQDTSIEEILAELRTKVLDDSVGQDVLQTEINAAAPALIGPPGARRMASGVLKSLEDALKQPLANARAAVGALQPRPPPGPPPGPPPLSELNLGPNEQYRQAILEAAHKCNLHPAGLAALIDAEAAKKNGIWDKESANPTSTARGLTQFLKGTWLQMAVLPGTALNQEAKKFNFVNAKNEVADQIALLKLRFDPRLSILSAAEYAASNLKIVLAKKPKYPTFYDPATPDGLMRLAYLCHHEGPGGALTYLHGGKPPSYVEFLDNYIERKIVLSRFLPSAQPIPVPPQPPGAPISAKPVPGSNPVDFAKLGTALNGCHWPVITSISKAMEIAHQSASGSPVGRESRRFLADRQGGKRFHVGLDLFCQEGDVVLAVADGTIINYYPFYEGTWALLISHSGVVINYGEVAPNAPKEFGWKVGGKVTPGQRIARVGGLNMIHFETYAPGTNQNARWMKGGQRPANLLNPTSLLLGLAAQATRLK
jgi:muramidase (phage lysozyme)